MIGGIFFAMMKLVFGHRDVAYEESDPVEVVSIEDEDQVICDCGSSLDVPQAPPDYEPKEYIFIGDTFDGIFNSPEEARPLKEIPEPEFSLTQPQHPRGDFFLQPNYPAECLALKAEGSVTVQFDIMPDGHVKNITILSTDHQCFNEEVIKTVRRWRYGETQNGFRGEIRTLTFTLAD